MKYIYEDVENAKAGDIVECTTNAFDSFTKGKLYISTGFHKTYKNDICVTTDDKNEANGLHKKYWKLLKTLPGSEAKMGDTVICTKWNGNIYTEGETYIVGKSANQGYTVALSDMTTGNFLVLCREEATKPVTREDWQQYFEAGNDVWFEMGGISKGQYKKCYDVAGSIPKDKIAECPFFDHDPSEKTIEVGDTVEYIGPPDSKRPNTCIALGGTYSKDNVYYAPFNYCNKKYWKLIYKANKSTKEENPIEELTQDELWKQARDNKDNSFILTNQEIDTKYEVYSNDTFFKIGDIVELIHDDKTSCPELKKIDTDISGYIYWCNLKPYQEVVLKPYQEKMINSATSSDSFSYFVDKTRSTNPRMYHQMKSRLIRREQEILDEESAMKPKVGDKVIATRDTSVGNHVKGDIETITKIDGNDIWVSNTNDLHWQLGTTWKLYAGANDLANEQNKTTSEETQMKQETNTTNVQVIVNGNDILKDTAKATKKLTQFEAKKRYTGVIYYSNGTLDSTIYKDTKGQLKSVMQQPENLGKTIVIHKAIDCFTTNIPLVQVKL